MMDGPLNVKLASASCVTVKKMSFWY